MVKGIFLNRKILTCEANKKMGVNVMNTLPVKKQFEIMDLIYQNLSTRMIARRTNLPKSTIQDYKKRGPPVYRNYLKNRSDNRYPTTLQEEIKVARQQFQEILLLNNQLVIERNNANWNVGYLQADNSGKDRKIDWLNQIHEANDKTLNQQDITIHMLNSRIDQLIKIVRTLIFKDIQRDIDGKKILEDLEHYKIDLEKAQQLISFSEKEIHDVTQQRDEFKDKVERMERKHEHDWILNLIVDVLCFVAGIVVDQTVLPKIKNFILSWGVEHEINTGDYANLISPVNVIHPDFHYIHNGASLETNTSGTICSGAIYTNYGEKHGTRFEAIPNQQEGVIQPSIHHIAIGVSLDTNTSGIPCSGSFSNNYVENKGI